MEIKEILDKAKIGMTISKVINLLKSNTFIGLRTKKNKKFYMLKYDEINLYFDEKERLWLICSYDKNNQLIVHAQNENYIIKEWN